MYRIATEFELTLEALCTQMLPQPELRVWETQKVQHAGKLHENTQAVNLNQVNAYSQEPYPRQP